MKQYLCIGSYTEPILFGTGEVFQGKGTGVTIATFEDGVILAVSTLPVRNPSFVAIRPENKHIYAVNEMKEYGGKYGGGLTEIVYDENYKMSIVGDWCVGGTDPCYIDVSPDGTFLATANFADGSVSVYPVEKDGKVDGQLDLHKHEGSSIDPKRQRGPHAHSILFWPGEDRFLVPDLGIDTLKSYSFKDGKVAEDNVSADVKVAPGFGPRYGEFDASGKNFYLVNEIGCAVAHFKVDGDKLEFVEAHPTIPEGYVDTNICADLHITPDGRFLYASNRGMDTIALFYIQENGRLMRQAIVDCGGKTPRNFAIDPSGQYLLCGNQDTDEIVVSKIQKDGSLIETSRYKTGSPVCVKFF